MAKAEQLIQLLRSHAEGDDDRFYRVALQVAAYEARRGHQKLAQELKHFVDQARSKKSRENSVVTLIQPKSEMESFLSISEPHTKLSYFTFSDHLKKVFKRIILEFKQQEKLHLHGLHPRRKLLLYGPPGTGKTITASALASELHFPLFTIKLDGLITKYMGETAGKLRQVFESMRATQGVYFFDEFDAIGSDRHSTNDVGEIRRVLNSFLTFMEEDKSDSLIIAATNYVDLLDFALFRRFDDVVHYMLPDKRDIKPIIKNRLYKFQLKNISWNKIEGEALGLSHAEITRACDDAAKFSILEKDGAITTEELLNMLQERKSANRNK